MKNDGKFIQYMDDSWPFLTDSDPIPTCEMIRKGYPTEILGSCNTFSGSVEIDSFTNDIDALYILEIHVYGVKLTSTLGETTAGPASFRVEALDSGGA